MVRITLMYYVDFYSLFNNPDKDWKILLAKASGAPSEPSLCGLRKQKSKLNRTISAI